MSPEPNKTPSREACADLTHDVAMEVEKAFTGQQSDEDALINIDELLGAREGHEPADRTARPDPLAAARSARFGPSDGGPNEAADNKPT